MKTELSIIIPCYNCQDTLEEAVESCFIQGLENFEVVMVDDGSTDRTRDLMREIASKHPEIKLFYHEKNMGGGATRNTAIKNSKGEIIFCLDSDDILPKVTLSRMLFFLKEKNCDGVAIHRSIKFIGNDTKNINHVDISSCIDKKIPLSSLFQKDGEFCPVYVNFMYTKDAFNKMKGYPTGHGYDTQGFAWRFLCAGLSAYTCKDAEYLHRVNFNESYFLREYNNGKMNYNWRDILLEHYYVFNKKTIDFICAFDCSDFTRNIMNELVHMDNIFISDYENYLGKSYTPLQIKFSTPVYVKRNSLTGYYFRIKARIRKIINL